MIGIRLLAVSLSLFIVSCNGGNFASNGLDEADPSQLINKGDTPQQSEDAKGDKSGKAPDNDDANSEADAQRCQELVGADGDTIHLAGNRISETITASGPFSARLTGNMTQLNLTMDGAEGSSPGMCLSLAGNQTQANVTASVAIEHAYIIARGNETQTMITVPAGVSISQITWDARGNQSRLQLTGDGDFPCPEAGNQSQVTCE